MAPIETLIAGLRRTESFEDASQASYMLARHRADLFAPCFVAVGGNRRVGFDQSGSPIRDDSPFFPVSLANERIPFANKRSGDLKRSSIQFRRNRAGCFGVGINH